MMSKDATKRKIYIINLKIVFWNILILKSPRLIKELLNFK